MGDQKHLSHIFYIKNNILSDLRGGQTGIRTLETVSRLHTFQACAFDHSATCPWARFSAGEVQMARPEIYVFAGRCHSLTFGP